MSNGQYGFLTTLDGCIKNCSSNQQCTHFTFHPSSRNCYMKYGSVKPSDVIIYSNSQSVCGIVPIATNWQATNCGFASNSKLFFTGTLNDCINNCSSENWCTQLTYQDGGRCYLQTSLDNLSDPPIFGSYASGKYSICMTFKNYQFMPTTTTTRVVFETVQCDFIGNDIKVYNPVGIYYGFYSTLDECIKKCSSTPECTHFTFDDAKVCYIKRGSVKPSDVRISEGYSVRSVCGILPITTNWQSTNCYFASASKLYYISSLHDCMLDCIRYDWCTILNYENNYCSLDDSVDDLSNPPIMTSGTEYKYSICMTFKNYKFRRTTTLGWATVSCDWYGNDIALSNGPYGFLSTLDGCIKNCSSNQQCTHFTFNPDNKYCSMKYGSVKPNDVIIYSNSQSICGIVPIASNWQETNCNFASDIKLSITGSLNDCIQKCISLDWCTQLTYQDGGKCYLQSSVDDLSDPPIIKSWESGSYSICMTFKNYQFIRTTTTTTPTTTKINNEVRFAAVDCDWNGNDIALSDGQYGFSTNLDGCIKTCSSNQQ